MTFLQISALAYVVVYYGLLLGYRGYLLYKKTGINPITNKENKGLPGFIERVFLVTFIMISVIAFNYVFPLGNYHLLIPIEYLELTWIGGTGVVASFSGLFIGFAAQMQMGNSWRLGINANEKTDLVMTGLFNYSRNPIYLGIWISNIGFFLIMPNAFSLCLVVVNYIAFEVKIRLEEEYLEKHHSNSYFSYKKKVRRWF